MSLGGQLELLGGLSAGLAFFYLVISVLWTSPIDPFKGLTRNDTICSA